MQPRHLLTLVSSLTVLACDSNGPTDRLRGEFQATSFLTIDGTDTLDVLDFGGELKIDFVSSASFRGTLRVPIKETDTLRGAWVEESDSVRFKTNPPSLIEQLSFARVGHDLVVDDVVGDTRYKITLQPADEVN